MDIYSRHVFRQVAGALLLILISLTMIVWMATALKQLKLVTSQGQSFVIFLKITMLALPSLMSFIAPVALLIACLHVLNRISGDSELIVMNAGGANIWRIAKPFLTLALIVSSILLTINIYIQPLSLRTLKEYVIQVRTDLISQVMQPGQFSSPERGLTFHIRERARNGDLLGLVIQDSRDTKRVMTYLAERGRLYKDENGDASLDMFNGHIHIKENGAKGIRIISYAKYTFNLSQLGGSGFGSGKKKKKIHYKPRESYINELINPDKQNHIYRRQPGKFTAELHERFASPLYPILFAMIAVAMIGQAETTRQKSMKGVFAAFGLSVLVKILGVAASNAISKNPHMVGLVYAIPVTAFMIAAYIAQAKLSYKKAKKVMS